MLREVVQVDNELLRELEDLENELFDNAWNATTIARELRTGMRLWVVGERQVDGYMLVRETDGVADLLRLGVHPRRQAQGLGTLLLQTALHNFPRLMLTVRKANRVALRLYRKHGFQIVGDLETRGESPAWVMVTSPAS